MQIPDNVIHEQIAQQLLLHIPEESRNQIMVKAVQQALAAYSFRNAVEKAVEAEAERAAATILADPAVQAQIADAVRRGVNDLIDLLPEVMLGFLAYAFAGEKEPGSYSYRGPLNAHLYAAIKARDKAADKT